MVTCELSGDRGEFSGVVRAIVDENQLRGEADSCRPILEAESVNSDDIATILYTSGTTGLSNCQRLIAF